MADNGNLAMLKNRRALEALRNGVPNGDAVAALGCNQSAVESNFNTLLSRVSDGADMPETSLGMLVAGEFGSGKSHLLGYLEARALAQSFVCSRVVISKEKRPLFDLDKVYRANRSERKGSGNYRSNCGRTRTDAKAGFTKLCRVLHVG